MANDIYIQTHRQSNGAVIGLRGFKTNSFLKGTWIITRNEVNPIWRYK